MKKTAIVIGASSEIGLETAKQLSEQGYCLALTYNKNKIDFENQLHLKKDCSLNSYHLDLTDKESIKSFFNQVEKDFSYIDTLVFVSGIAQKRALIFDVANEEIDNLLDVNLKSVIICIKHFTKMLLNKNPANIVIVGSFVEKNGCSCESVYTATKSALSSLAKSLASELGNLGTRINVVAPGFINTKMNNNLTDEEKAEIASMTPLQRLGTTTDIANAITFLCSDKASFITGQTLFVDGGLVLE